MNGLSPIRERASDANEESAAQSLPRLTLIDELLDLEPRVISERSSRISVASDLIL